MSDLHDPYGPTQMRNRHRANSELGWIAGAVFLVVVLALVFGLGHGDRTASTGTTPPAATTGAASPASGPATTAPTPGQVGSP